MVKGNTRHMFPGGNTYRGFYSYYDYIMPQERARRIFVIKGGPGTGKSTFMRRAAERLNSEGYDVETFHCSSDPDSLDGIVVPTLEVAIMDGTAPHVVDPKNPGAVDEIINLGDCWDTGGMEADREEILGINREIGRLFRRAYRYLAAAAPVHEDNSDIFEMVVDRQKAAMTADRIIKEYFQKDPISGCEGGVRKLFATAITPQGLKNYIPSALNAKTVIVLKGGPGTGADRVIGKVTEAARERGFYTEVFFCALFPERPEHMVVPGKDLGIATSNRYHTVMPEDGEVMDLGGFIDKKLIGGKRDIIEYNRLEFEGLLNRAIMTLEQAKRLHDHLEKLYIANMDFDAVDEYIEKTVARIEAMA